MPNEQVAADWQKAPAAEPGALGIAEERMFERYTQEATRVIFFARYAASQFGTWSIETEHLLLGLLRENQALVSRFLRPGDSIEGIRREVEERAAKTEGKVSTSIDLPLSPASKLVLTHAAAEAEGLSHHQIGALHVLLGLLREETSLASEILRSHGLDPFVIRQQFEARNSVKPKAGFVPDEETATRIAEAVWIAIYGKEKVESQKPFQVEVENDVWIVRGSFRKGGSEGGVIARISKANGTIFEVSQDQ